MRIAFVGLPIAALLLARDGHEIVWAGVCRRDALGVRRLRRALGSKMFLVPDLAKHAADVRALAPDLVVSWFWTKKIPASFRIAGRLGALGVHPSLLPRHRGPDPTFWAIDAGDAETGVTAHELEDDYDTGAILGVERLAIDPRWNAWTLAKKLDRPSLRLLRKTVQLYENPSAVRRHPQDESSATEAPTPRDEDLEIFWSWDAARVVRRIRAASPWPGAFTDIGGDTLVVTDARVTDDFPKVLAPGQAFVRKDGIAVVRAADKAVELLGGRPDDGEDREDNLLDAFDLAAVIDAARDGESTLLP